MEELPPKESVKLDYASAPPAPPEPPRRNWFSRLITRCSTPMPLGMYYLITTILGIIALAIMLLIKLILSAIG